MVYVMDRYGQPLMPTERHGKVRRLLKSGEAKVVKRCPFTIMLLYETKEHNTQPVTLGVDAGSKHIGLSACTEKQELYAADVELRDDVSKLLSDRRERRRTRRNRLRYRKPRFQNRIRTKHKGWIAPSIEQKIGTHLTSIESVCRILPVTKIIVETAQFDVQKIRDPEIEGTGYQQGEQLGFWNVREYVLYRDRHTCQCCGGRSKDPVLNVHHIKSRKTGGNAPNNLITLCETCHKGYHAGTIKLPENIRRGMKFDDATLMNILRGTLFERLKSIYPDVQNTYGYLTKNTRIERKLPKEHVTDARCITGYPDIRPCGCVYYRKKVRRHNRQIHKANFIKGGRKKLNQAPYLVHGFRLYDKVRYQRQECFVYGRRMRGYFRIGLLDGTVIGTDINCRQLKLLEARSAYITERREAIPQPPAEVAVPSLGI